MFIAYKLKKNKQQKKKPHYKTSRVASKQEAEDDQRSKRSVWAKSILVNQKTPWWLQILTVDYAELG